LNSAGGESSVVVGGWRNHAEEAYEAALGDPNDAGEWRTYCVSGGSESSLGSKEDCFASTP